MRIRNKLMIGAVLATLIAATAAIPAAAAPGDSASAQLTYTCPFTGADVVASFEVAEVADHLKGDGYATFSVPARGAAFDVKPKLVRVDGDEVFFAGPIVNGSLPGLNGAWWYFAAKAGDAASGYGGAFGMYIVGAQKWDFVEQGFLYFDDFQPLLDGWATVNAA